MVKVVAFDFDGVFTDNSVYIDSDGTESVKCCRSDGIGLTKLIDAGVHAVVISAESDRVVSRRCRKLGIRLIVAADKLAALEQYLSFLKSRYGHDISMDDVCFVGNDLPDLLCMQHVGFPVAVRNAYPEVLAAAKMVTVAMGGRGAVREVCEEIVARYADG